MSEEARAEIRADLEAVAAPAEGPVAPDRSGQRAFLGSSFVFAYMVQAPLMVASFQPDDYRTGVGIYMLASTAGFFVPLLATRGRDVTKTHAELFLHGGAQGAATVWAINGLTGRVALDQVAAVSALGGSVLGEVAGFAADRERQKDPVASGCRA